MTTTETKQAIELILLTLDMLVTVLTSLSFAAGLFTRTENIK